MMFRRAPITSVPTGSLPAVILRRIEADIKAAAEARKTGKRHIQPDNVKMKINAI